MKELLEGYDQSIKPKKSYSFKAILFYFLAGIIVIATGIYAGDVLFGKRSYEVLQNLQKEKLFLYKDIERMKKKNAELQKQYLERKALDPEMSRQ